jgi:hypothetical protein
MNVFFKNVFVNLLFLKCKKNSERHKKNSELEGSSLGKRMTPFPVRSTGGLHRGRLHHHALDAPATVQTVQSVQLSRGLLFTQVICIEVASTTMPSIHLQQYKLYKVYS